MGEVYRARQQVEARRRDQDRAELFASDADRVARFQREAELLATLNHPDIAAIYGVEGDRAIVMEFVEGETLAERVARGPVPSTRRFDWQCKSPARSKRRTIAG